MPRGWLRYPTNDKQDRMLMSTDLLQLRLNRIKVLRIIELESNPNTIDSKLLSMINDNTSCIYQCVCGNPKSHPGLN